MSGLVNRVGKLKMLREIHGVSITRLLTHGLHTRVCATFDRGVDTKASVYVENI